MSDSGRFYVTIDGRKFCVEPIGNGRPGDWGGYNSNQQSKHPGSCEEKDSIITEENGFKNIVTLPPGCSPIDYIENLVKKEQKEEKEQEEGAKIR